MKNRGAAKIEDASRYPYCKSRNQELPRRSEALKHQEAGGGNVRRQKNRGLNSVAEIGWLLEGDNRKEKAREVRRYLNAC